MGQGDSKPQPGRTLGSGEVLENRAPTPENERVDPQERARLQAEDRARRAAAAEQRFTAMKKKGANGPLPPSIAAGKKLSALEELSRENKGWRDADEQAELRAYN